MLKDYIKLGRVTLGLSAFSLVLLGVTYLDQPIPARDIALCLASAFFFAIGVYSFNNVTDVAEDKINKPDSPLVKGRKKHLGVLAFSILCKAAAIALAYMIGWGSFLVLCLAALVSFMYSHEFFGMRIKAVPVLKNIAVGGIWALAPLVLVFAENIGIPGGFLFLILFVFLQRAISSVLADISDMNGDRLQGIKTIPMIIGEDNTIYLLMGINAISCIALLAGIIFWNVKAYLALVPLIGVWNQYGFMLMRNKKKTAKYVYDRFDGPADFLILALAAIGLALAAF